ncbi:MAG: hypothetical protein IK077_07310 [Thermoguttaceae bacterium]|nr:hypothetical protein [Thermoguttaceae bacterium]
MSDENEKQQIDENEQLVTMGDFPKEPTKLSRRKSIVGLFVALGAAFLASLGFVVWRRSKRPFGRLMGDVPMGKMIVGDDEEEPMGAIDAPDDSDQTPEVENDGGEDELATPEVENGGDSPESEPSESI